MVRRQSQLVGARSYAQCVTPGVRSLVAIGIAVLALSRAAGADQVTSKGTLLHGTITAIAGSGVTFEPEYGKGSLAIKWKDIDDITTAGRRRGPNTTACS